MRLKDVYWTVGPYDLVGIIDAPDEESASAAMLQLGAAGNLRTTTMRAYSSDEFKADQQGRLKHGGGSALQ